MKSEIREDGRKKVYNVKFANLTDLQDFLLSNPKINSETFDNPSSVRIDRKFVEMSLEEAINCLTGGYTEGLDNFLRTNGVLRETTVANLGGIDHSRRLIKTVCGGVPIASLVAAGVPNCNVRYVYDESSVVRNVYFNVAYGAEERKEQIINRGLIATYIIQALEKKGEMVNFSTFTLLSDRIDNPTEMVNIDIVMKKPDDLFLDVNKCYFPLTNRAFLRRVIFRVLETLPLKPSWACGYGNPCGRDAIKDFYKASSSDIIISKPRELGIEGEDIYADTIATIETLGLEKEFDIPKIKKIGEMKRR